MMGKWSFVHVWGNTWGLGHKGKTTIRDCEHNLEEEVSTEERPGRKNMIRAHRKAEFMDRGMEPQHTGGSLPGSWPPTWSNMKKWGRGACSTKTTETRGQEESCFKCPGLRKLCSQLKEGMIWKLGGWSQVMEWEEPSRDSSSRRIGRTRSVSGVMSVWGYSRALRAPSDGFPSRGTVKWHLFLPIGTSGPLYSYLHSPFFIPSRHLLMSLIWTVHFGVILISLPDSSDLILLYHTLSGFSFTTTTCH